MLIDVYSQMSEVQNIDELPTHLKTAHHVLAQLEKDMPITIQVCYISYITNIYVITLEGMQRYGPVDDTWMYPFK